MDEHLKTRPVEREPVILPVNKRSNRTKKHSTSIPFKPTRPRGYITLFLLICLVFSPILSNPTLWTGFDAAERTSLKNMQNWQEVWSLESIRKNDPISLTSYFAEQALPEKIAAPVHRGINIFLHFLAAFFLLNALETKKINGAYLVTLLFALHPSVIETLFWPGYRNEIIGMIFIMAALSFGFKNRNNFDYGVTVFLSTVASLIHPAALVIPIILALNILHQKRSFKFKDYNPTLPIFCICLFIGIWTLNDSNPSIATDTNNETIDWIALAGNNLYFHLSQSLLPLKLELFHPALIEGGTETISRISPAPFIFFTPIICFTLFKLKRTWARGVIFSVFSYIVFVIYALLQRGTFLDGSLAYENHSHYIALPALLTFVVIGMYSLASRTGLGGILLWRVCLVLILLLQLTFSLIFSYTLHNERTMWERMAETWPQASITKLAFLNTLTDKEKNKLPAETRIELINSILDKHPTMTNQRIELARTYVNAGQKHNALREYKKVLRESNPQNELLEEAATFYDTMNLNWEATNARKRKIP